MLKPLRPSPASLVDIEEGEYKANNMNTMNTRGCILRKCRFKEVNDRRGARWTVSFIDLWVLHLVMSSCLIGAKSTWASNGFMSQLRDLMRDCLILMRNGFRSHYGDNEEINCSIIMSYASGLSLKRLYAYRVFFYYWF